MTKAERVREYARRTYIEPARRRKEHTVRIVAGDVHRALGFRSNVPSVCSALRSKAFLEENRLKLEREEGPPSGQGTRLALTYSLQGAPGTNQARSAFLALRGIAREMFAALGGGEAFIHAERDSFQPSGSTRRP